MALHKMIKSMSTLFGPSHPLMRSRSSMNLWIVRVMVSQLRGHCLSQPKNWRIKINPLKHLEHQIVKPGRPGVSGNGTYLFGLTIFPWTVGAMSWRKKDEGQESIIRRNLRNSSLRNSDVIKYLVLSDDLYVGKGQGATHEDIYQALLKYKDLEEPEVLWRLGRVTYELSKKGSGQQKTDLVEEAYQYISQALKIDENNFAVHKWMAIILNTRSTLKGTKEQILQSYNVKFHMDKASELNPNDATCIYLVGNWCYYVADIPWYQRKIAETVFAKPPSSSYEEATKYFLRAEEVEPLFYSMNLLMLAKSYMKLGQHEKAEEALLKIQGMACVTEEDEQAKQEALTLLKQIGKGSPNGPSSSEAAPVKLNA